MTYNLAHKLVLSFAMVMALSLIPAHARAENNIAVVNIQQIMVESKAAKNIQTQLDAQRKSFQEEFSKHERDLMEEEKKLKEEHATMPAEEFGKKWQDFEKTVQDTRKLAQKRQKALEEGAGKALTTLRDEVMKIVADISDKEKYDLVLTRQNVILAQKDMDITDEVMKRLNKSLKEVKLKVDTN